MVQIEIFNPDALAAPGGAYSHVARVSAGATIVEIAGQIAMDRDRNVVGAGDFERQCDQVFENLGTALRASGADWRNVMRFMTFITRREDIARLREWREREFPRLFPDGAYPPNTLLIVNGLATEELLLEVQVSAAI
ncbi:MAG: RidA family protein [Chloroflexota bacterium]